MIKKQLLVVMFFTLVFPGRITAGNEYIRNLVIGVGVAGIIGYWYGEKCYVAGKMEAYNNLRRRVPGEEDHIDPEAPIHGGLYYPDCSRVVFYMQQQRDLIAQQEEQLKVLQQENNRLKQH